MSRNKAILIVIIVAILYFVTPNEGAWHTLKVNFVALLPYILAAIIIYLIITIQVLKKAWRKLDDFICDDNVINFVKIMNISFDVKRMLGPNNLIDLYAKVNFSTRASMHAKEMLYDAMRRKRLDVPKPGKGTDINKMMAKNHNQKTDDEIKAARIEAAARERKRKHKKKSQAKSQAR